MNNSELPSGWADTTIADVTTYISRGKSPKYAEHSSLPVVNQRAIRWFGIQDEHLKYVHPDQFDQWTSERFIQKGDILWNSTGTGTIGRACLVRSEHLTPPKVVDSHVTIVRFNRSAIDPRYLFAWIRSPEIQRSISDLASGSTNQIELGRATIAETRIPLAPFNEQRRIADKLDVLLARVDACREQLERVPVILKRFRQTVLVAAMTGELTADWRESNPDLSDWQVADVQSVAAVGTGSTPLRSNPNYYIKNGTPWITSAATSDPIITEAYEFVSDAAIKAHRLKRYPIGTLLVAMYGEGKTRGQVAELGIEATINQACAAIIVDESEAMKAFVKMALQANYLEMRQLAEGGNQPNLNLSKIKEFVLPLPPLEEQHEIVRRVESLFAYVGALEARYHATREQVERLTPALLSKAFCGELVPQDPNDEPASVLLERIYTGRATAVKDSTKRTRKTTMSKNTSKKKPATPIAIVDAIRETGNDISSRELLVAAGYAGDAGPEEVEEFLVAIREALGNNQISRQRRDGEDWFSLADSMTEQ